MAVHQSQKWCKACGKKTLHAQHTFSTAAGCLLTLLTAGLFLPIWIVIMGLEGLTVRWRCQQCGQARLF